MGTGTGVAHGEENALPHFSTHTPLPPHTHPSQQKAMQRTMTRTTRRLTSMLARLLVVLMASMRLEVDTRLTGLTLPFPRGDSKPESMLDSELLELRLRVRGNSMAAL